MHSTVSLSRLLPTVRSNSSCLYILILFLALHVSAPSLLAHQVENNDEAYYINVHPYFELPLKKLAKEVPELKKLQPAADQTHLAEILEKTGANVDAFFSHIVDLIAQETITQQRLSHRTVIGTQRAQDHYLILRESQDRHDPDAPSDMVEYRMDADGNRIEQLGRSRGYLITVGFALICNYFSSDYQRESLFHFLGTQKLGSRLTYVVAFAQKPGEATQLVTMSGPRAMAVHILMQGIAWVDQGNFQIVRLRTDLLAPRPEVALERQTTEVTFTEVRLQDLSIPLWLPKDVDVYLGVREPTTNRQLSFRNEHHYQDYRRYRVSVKMVAPPAADLSTP